MRSIKSKLKMNKNDNVTLSLSADDINNVLYGLAYVYHNDDEIDRYTKEKYKNLYTKTLKDAIKTLGKETLIDDYGFDLDINKVSTRY